MTRRRWAISLVPLVSACASGAPAAPRSAPEPGAMPSAATSPTPSSPAVGMPPTASPSADVAPSPAASPRPPPPPPPLSSPNAAAPSADAGAPSDAGPGPADDPQTAALRALALAAQECHAREVPNARGKLMLRLTLGNDGRVVGAEVVRAATDDALAAQGFVACVLRAARKPKFPAPRADDVQLELPLSFEPVQ